MINSIVFKVFVIFFITLSIVNGFPVRRGRFSKHPRNRRYDKFPLALRALHNSQLFSGDIVRYPRFQNRNAVSQTYWLWPNAEIPYYIDPSLNSQKSLILNAMDQFRQYTCIKFRERTSSDRDYVRIFKGVGCYSTIGRDEDNSEMISLGDGCYFEGTIVHELMHTVGFYHEQNRSDRDDFITIHWDNIDSAYKEEFQKMDPADNQILTPFDFNSIMLYGSHSYSKDGKLITMEPKFPEFKMIEVYEKPGMTAMDAKAIKLLYKCH